MERTFRSMDEFERHYFPEAYKQKIIERMSPEELGKYMAKETIKELHNGTEKLKRYLKKLKL